MRILADENVSGAIVKLSRLHEHDVYWISEKDAGIDDEAVWDIAKNELRFLITADKVFAARAMVSDEAKILGLMLLRIPTLSAEDGAERVAKIIQSQNNWRGKYCVVSKDGVRLRQI